MPLLRTIILALAIGLAAFAQQMCCCVMLPAANAVFAVKPAAAMVSCCHHGHHHKSESRPVRNDGEDGTPEKRDCTCGLMQTLIPIEAKARPIVYRSDSPGEPPVEVVSVFACAGWSGDAAAPRARAGPSLGGFGGCRGLVATPVAMHVMLTI